MLDNNNYNKDKIKSYKNNKKLKETELLVNSLII